MAMDLIDTGDLWKYKFRALQLRLRDRLRVAVDKHWHRNRLGIISEGYFSSTIQRLALRVRNLREESLPAASKFYRKRVNKDALEDSALVRMVQAVAVPILGNVCHVFMNGLNHIQVYGVEKLHEALLRRPEGKPLITVSNHVASVDDPFVIASLVPPNVMLDARNLRWTLCATDRCFKNPVTSAFFRSVKVLPVSRGDGIYQNGMDMALSKLNNGGWVHIFPEGSRSRDGGRTMGSTKRGVGRLVMDADKIPIVLPFVHTGMQDIMPIGANFPRIGQMVTVLIGDPIDFSDLLAADNESIPRGKLYDAVASRIGQRLHKLKVQVDRLALERSIKLQNYHFQNAERATGIFQEVDWEAFGMGTYILAEDEGSSSLIKVIQTERNLNLDQEPSSPPPTSDRYFRVGFGLSRDEGIMSRVRGYMDPTDLMGFAARGMFINSRTQKENLNTSTAQEVGPLKVWKQFFEANIFHQWDCR